MLYLALYSSITLSHETENVIDGDSTVVIPSQVMHTDWTAYYLNLPAYNHAANKHADHGTITETSSFQQLFDELVVATSSSVVLPQYVTTTEPSKAESGKRLRVHLDSYGVAARLQTEASPYVQTAISTDPQLVRGIVSLDAYDSAGNHTGIGVNPNPLSDLQYVERQIPGSYYNETGAVKNIGLMYEGTYRLVLKGQHTGTFTFDIVPVVGGNEQQPITFADVPVTASSTATIDLSVDTPEQSALVVDLDGDGKSDFTLPANGNTTQSPASYLSLMTANIGKLGLSKEITQRLTADLNPVQGMLGALKSVNSQALTPQITAKLDGIDAYVRTQYAGGALPAQQAGVILSMTLHLRELVQN